MKAILSLFLVPAAVGFVFVPGAIAAGLQMPPLAAPEAAVGASVLVGLAALIRAFATRTGRTPRETGPHAEIIDFVPPPAAAVQRRVRAGTRRELLREAA